MIVTTSIFLSQAFEEIQIMPRTSFTPCGSTCQSLSDQERDGWSGRFVVGGGGQAVSGKLPSTLLEKTVVAAVSVCSPCNKIKEAC